MPVSVRVPPQQATSSPISVPMRARRFLGLTHHAVHGEHALDERPALAHGPGDGGGGGDIDHHAARVHRQSARGNAAAGEHLDELLFAALRVLGAHRADVHVRPRGLLQALGGVGLVVLHADEHLPRADDLRGDAQTVHHRVRVFEHHAMIGAQKRLALRAVEDDGVDRLVLGRRELDVRGKRRPAQADDARLADGCEQQRGVVRAGDAFVLDPFVEAVVFQNDRGSRAGPRR